MTASMVFLEASRILPRVLLWQKSSRWQSVYSVDDTAVQVLPSSIMSVCEELIGLHDTAEQIAKTYPINNEVCLPLRCAALRYPYPQVGRKRSQCTGRVLDCIFNGHSNENVDVVELYVTSSLVFQPLAVGVVGNLHNHSRG